MNYLRSEIQVATREAAKVIGSEFVTDDGRARAKLIRSLLDVALELSRANDIPLADYQGIERAIIAFRAGKPF